jgi:hypothetical protein
MKFKSILTGSLRDAIGQTGARNNLCILKFWNIKLKSSPK